MKLPQLLLLTVALVLPGTTSAESPVKWFDRVSEKNEGAFSMLIPHGWQTEGGILRFDPSAMGGPAQSIEAKLDMAVKKDAAGTVMGRVLSDMRYIDLRYSPAGQMGLFPPGSNYNGMLVFPLPSAAQFITQMAFPYVHPQAQNVQVIDQRSAPGLARAYLQQMQSLPLPQTFTTDAAVVAFTYQEGGIPFKEVWSAVILDWGSTGAGMWENKETRFMRAPVSEFDTWVPVFSLMQASVKINPQWVAGEIRGQIQRGQIMLDTQREIQRIENEIVANRQRTNAQIQQDMYLTLTGQEDYKNPFTGEIETRSRDLGQYRWVNDLGQEIYSPRSDYNPDDDPDVRVKGWRKSEPTSRHLK